MEAGENSQEFSEIDSIKNHKMFLAVFSLVFVPFCFNFIIVFSERSSFRGEQIKKAKHRIIPLGGCSAHHTGRQHTQAMSMHLLFSDHLQQQLEWYFVFKRYFSEYISIRIKGHTIYKMLVLIERSTFQCINSWHFRYCMLWDVGWEAD